jgi:hypothetical protein
MPDSPVILQTWASLIDVARKLRTPWPLPLIAVLGYMLLTLPILVRCGFDPSVFIHAAAAMRQDGRPAPSPARSEPPPTRDRTASLHFFQQCHRPDAGTAGKQRQNVALPQATERVDDLSPQRALGGFLGG